MVRSAPCVGCPGSYGESEHEPADSEQGLGGEECLGLVEPRQDHDHQRTGSCGDHGGGRDSDPAQAHGTVGYDRTRICDEALEMEEIVADQAP